MSFLRFIEIALTLVVTFSALATAALVTSEWIYRHREMVRGWFQTIVRWILLLPLVRYVRRRFPRTAAFVENRLSREGYLGVHLTIGLILSLAALWLFVEVADQVIDRNGLAAFDVKFDNDLHHRASDSLVQFFKGVSFFGSVPWVGAILLVVSAILAAKKNWMLLTGWLVALGGAGILDGVLKLIFRRPRPTFDLPFVTLDSWSFPSGHSMGSMVLYGMVAYLLRRIFSLNRWQTILATVAAAGVILLIGFSRLYLGAHYPTDVIGGYAAGVVWLSACITGLEMARRRRPPESSAPLVPS